MLLYSVRLALSLLERCRLSSSPIVQQLLLNIYTLHKNKFISNKFLTAKMNAVKVDLLMGNKKTILKQRQFSCSKSANNKNI